jgi:hypothetical protein
MMAVHKGVGHYGAPITLDQAKKVMAAAEAKAIENNWYVAISIVDSNPVMLHRLDGTQLASIRIAEGKALTAVEFRRPTKALEDCYREGRCGPEVLHRAKCQFHGGRRPDFGRWQGRRRPSACQAWTRRTMQKLLRLGPTLLGDRCD